MVVGESVAAVTETLMVAAAKLVPSVTLTVCVAVACVAVGVPVTTPVDAFKVSPAGNGGLTLKVLVPVTFAAVKAVVAVMAVPTRAVMVCVAGLIVGTEAIVSRIVAFVKLVPSAAVTTNVVAATAAVGVPESTPVAELNDSPAGSAGANE